MVVEDRVRCLDHPQAESIVHARVEIAVEPGEVAAADLKPQFVPFPKQITS